MIKPHKDQPVGYTWTGTFVANLTITIKSSIPTSQVIACTLYAETEDADTMDYFQETATVTATRSGSTATCSVTIPYSWVLAVPGDDVATVYFSISTPAGTAGPGLPPTRASQQTMFRSYVPADGATTTIDYTVTL